ncbi:MAG: TonB system transport protein ExbD [Alphaproteobacteria bacterium]
MAVKLGGGRSGDDDDLSEAHEINVTPFIDVILVLLIIFMVAAPLATVDILVDLPESAAQQQPRPDKPIFLTVKADLTLAVGDQPVTHEGLAATLDQLSGSDKETRIFLRADRSIGYGDLMQTMNALVAAGYLKVVLVGLDAGLKR